MTSHSIFSQYVPDATGATLSLNEVPGTEFPKFAVVLVNYNGLNDTRKCLDSLLKAELRGALVIVVDNGSNPDCSEIISSEFPWARVVRSALNTGWSGGNNIGIKEAKEFGANYVLLLNNDTVVSPDILIRMSLAFKANPTFSIIGPIIRYMDEPDAVMTDGVVFNCSDTPGDFFTRQEVPISGSPTTSTIQVDIVNGCAICIDMKVITKIGLIDDRFFLIHEESEFCLRAAESGFRCGILAEGLVWHKGSSTFKRAGSWLQRYYSTRNLMLLLLMRRNSTRNSRGFISTWINYFKHVWYMYDIEMEENNRETAEAVVAGLADAMLGRFGMRDFRKSWLQGLFLASFDTARLILSR
jgi:GT2 family glycosyltransferase